MSDPAQNAASANASFATEIILRAADIVAGAAIDPDASRNAHEALRTARDEYLGGHLHPHEKSRTYSWPQLVNDLKNYLERRGTIPADTWGAIGQWSETADPGEVVQTLREAAPHVSKLVHDRTAAATAFELMDEKQRYELLIMKRAATFLSRQGLEVKIQWDRDNPDGPLDYRGTIDGVPWAFGLKALRIDPARYHRKVGHPNASQTLEEQLKALAELLPKIRDDAEALQRALDKAVTDAGKDSKLRALDGAKYCLVMHNCQFIYFDAWQSVTLPDLGAFDAVIILHHDTITPAWAWEVLLQDGIDKPLATQNANDLADISDFKMSRNRTPDPELVRYAWEHLEEMESIQNEPKKSVESTERNECDLPK
jgi:hypothetical protein